MKANSANKTEKIPEQSGEGVRIIQGVISFLSLFLPVTLAKRAAAMILISVGVPDEYTVEQMRFLIRNLENVKNGADRAYLAIQAIHPLRLEEVLGLKWEDVDLDAMTFHIRRAVTHPTRSQPEIKRTKTEASVRALGLSAIAASFLEPGNPDEFVFGGKTPYTCQKVRRMCERVKRDTEFNDNITPIRFRTTVLTDIYDRTKDVKTAQAAAGHASPTMTMRRYAKGRDGARRSGEIIDQVYGSD